MLATQITATNIMIVIVYSVSYLFVLFFNYFIVCCLVIFWVIKLLSLRYMHRRCGSAS